MKGRQVRLDTFKGNLVPTIASAGRKYSMEKDLDQHLETIDSFVLDEIKIGLSDALGRLPGKMQVISEPLNNHISNRRSHTDEVVAISVQIAYTLGLNVNLCRAAALGHDVGHCPFGPHGGEILGIKHALNGVIILQEVERLNLTKEVVHAILFHSLDKNNLDNDEKLSNEAFVVALADKFAYLPKDFEDFKRAGMLEGLCPPEELSMFGFENGGNFQRKMRELCINALFEESVNEGEVSFSKSEEAIAFQKIRKWAYDNVYKKLNDMPDRAYHKENLKIVLEYFIDNGLAENLAPEFAISMMTDSDVNRLAEILKHRCPTTEELNSLSITEIIKSLGGRKIDHTADPLW